jgi:hypothetical protein
VTIPEDGILQQKQYHACGRKPPVVIQLALLLPIRVVPNFILSQVTGYST